MSCSRVWAGCPATETAPVCCGFCPHWPQVTVLGFESWAEAARATPKATAANMSTLRIICILLPDCLGSRKTSQDRKHRRRDHFDTRDYASVTEDVKRKLLVTKLSDFRSFWFLFHLIG